MKIKKNDKVRIIAGKDKGRNGVIERVYQKQNKVLVTGINMYKKHIKKNEKMPQGGVVELPRPMNVSKIMFICPVCKKPVRLGYKLEKNKKVRICKACSTIV